MHSVVLAQRRKEKLQITTSQIIGGLGIERVDAEGGFASVDDEMSCVAKVAAKQLMGNIIDV
jgi:hypothetical protein